MSSRAERFERSVIQESLALAQQVFQASGSVFYWIDSQGHLTDCIRVGAPQHFFDEYHAGMANYDPLLARHLICKAKRVATLDHEQTMRPPAETGIYRQYLASYGFVTCAELVFWRDDEAFAGLGLLKRTSDPAVSDCALDMLRTIHPIVERSLYLHPLVRRGWSASRLAERYRLTPREIEIAELVCDGASNADIAAIAELSLATVKTHLVRIFEKLDVDNRASLVSLVLGLQLPCA